MKMFSLFLFLFFFKVIRFQSGALFHFMVSCPLKLNLERHKVFFGDKKCAILPIAKSFCTTVL